MFSHTSIVAILTQFTLDLPIAVLSSNSLQEAVAHAPEWWGRTLETKHNAIIVIPPKEPQQIMDEVGTAKSEYEQVFNYGPVIFWSAPLKTFSRTRWAKVTTKTSYGDITIRNANTIRKLLTLAQA